MKIVEVVPRCGFGNRPVMGWFFDPNHVNMYEMIKVEKTFDLKQSPCYNIKRLLWK